MAGDRIWPTATHLKLGDAHRPDLRVTQRSAAAWWISAHLEWRERFEDLSRRSESKSEQMQCSLSNTRATYTDLVMSPHGGKPTDSPVVSAVQYGVIDIVLSVSLMAARTAHLQAAGFSWLQASRLNDITQGYDLRAG